ncbi:nucleotide exchange factor GrpE [Dinghuibacter silviterrae]|nr:hypothetical protein [Dinghuibacter silviterrae]
MATLVFELEKKLAAAESPGIKRHLDRMKSVLDEAGILMLNPLGEPYQETRTDLEASILPDARGSLAVVDVIKPVLYAQEEGKRTLLQRGVVIVGSKA